MLELEGAVGELKGGQNDGVGRDGANDGDAISAVETLDALAGVEGLEPPEVVPVARVVSLDLGLDNVGGEEDGVVGNAAQGPGHHKGGRAKAVLAAVLAHLATRVFVDSKPGSAAEALPGEGGGVSFVEPAKAGAPDGLENAIKGAPIEVGVHLDPALDELNRGENGRDGRPGNGARERELGDGQLLVSLPALDELLDLSVGHEEDNVLHHGAHHRGWETSVEAAQTLVLENIHGALEGVHLLDARGHSLALKPDLDGIKWILDDLSRHSCELVG